SPSRALRDLGRLVMRSGATQLPLRLTASVVLVLVGKLAAVSAPVMLGEAINTLSVAGGVVTLGAGFLGLALAFAGLRMVAACAPYVRDAIFTVVAQATMARAAVEGFGHALSLSLDFHQSKQTGALGRIIERGARSTDFLMRSVVFNLGPTALELVLAMGVMVVRLDWRFALTAFVTVVIYALITFKITDWRLSHRRELNEADSRAAGLSVDALINFETVKTFGAESRAVASYERALASYVGAAVKANTSLSILNGAQAVILNLGLALMTVLAGLGVSQGQMQIGDITMAVLLLTGIYAPLNMLGFNYREIRQGFIDMEQLVALTERTPDIVEAPDAADLPPASPGGARLEFREVGFRHDARSQGLLNLSFVAEPGTTVALVGPS
ncbi:MAG TPA: ABC transporter ATP-binding protein/permease, partial [Phenylobacterium sp.]|nr:ABC transporter ATP-binding protein/permease [Phenylobacterium sp.]